MTYQLVRQSGQLALNLEELLWLSSFDHDLKHHFRIKKVLAKAMKRHHRRFSAFAYQQPARKPA